jgi:uncharacterized protein YndB with AHSA1/START domain
MFENLTIVAEPKKPTIFMKRMFAAPPAIVFEAWTKPEHVAQWWDPNGEPLAVCEIDLRVNGAFRWVNRGPDGVNHPFTGTYLKIAAPKQLKFTVQTSPSGSPSVGTLVFREKVGQTEFTLTIECDSVEQRDMLLKFRVDVGTAHTLENLAKYVDKMA